MSTFKDLSNELAVAYDKYILQREDIIDKLCKLIQDNIKQNNIKIINDKPRCFIVRASDIIGRPMSPSFYNFEYQCEFLIKQLKKAANPFDVINKVFEQKMLSVSENGLKTTILFHPDVIDTLKKLS